MGFVDHEGGAEYPYPRDVVFEALLAAVPCVAGMKVDKADKLSGRILAKADISHKSWGENILAVVSESAPGRTRVSISSTPKIAGFLPLFSIEFGGVFDLGKNRQNIERLLAALSDSLRNLPPTVPPVAARESRGDPAERIAKLKELADNGLITSAEFEKRKAEILSEV